MTTSCSVLTKKSLSTPRSLQKLIIYIGYIGKGLHSEEDLLRDLVVEISEKRIQYICYWKGFRGSL